MVGLRKILVLAGICAVAAGVAPASACEQNLEIVQVIADPVSTADEYAAAFRAEAKRLGINLRLIGAETAPPPDPLRMRDEDFDDTFRLHLPGAPSLTTFLEGLRGQVQIAVGSEVGTVPVAEWNHALSLPLANEYEFVEAWRNKWMLAQTLLKLPPGERGDFPVALQNIFTDVEEALVWVDEHFESGKKVVLKPLQSAATDGVSTDLVVGSRDWRRGFKYRFRAILGKVNLLGLQNNFVLVMQYLPGPEWAVNTMTDMVIPAEPRTVVTSVWDYNKLSFNGTEVYYLDPLMHPNRVRRIGLHTRAIKLTKMIGIRIGATHQEYKCDENGVPHLIDFAARSGGTHTAVLASAANGGRSQIEGMARVYLNPNGVRDWPEVYEMEQEAAIFVNVPLLAEGGLFRAAAFDELLDKRSPHFLATAIRAGAYREDGSKITLTGNLLQQAGKVMLVGRRADVERDVEKMVKLIHDPAHWRK